MKAYKFSASWCMPCKGLTMRIRNLDASIPEYDIDLPENRPLLEKFNVRAVPTIVIEQDDGSFVSYSGNSISDELIKQFV